MLMFLSLTTISAVLKNPVPNTEIKSWHWFFLPFISSAHTPFGKGEDREVAPPVCLKGNSTLIQQTMAEFSSREENGDSFTKVLCSEIVTKLSPVEQ